MQDLSSSLSIAQLIDLYQPDNKVSKGQKYVGSVLYPDRVPLTVNLGQEFFLSQPPLLPPTLAAFLVAA